MATAVYRRRGVACATGPKGRHERPMERAPFISALVGPTLCRPLRGRAGRPEVTAASNFEGPEIRESHHPRIVADD